MDHISALYVLWPSCYVPQVWLDIGGEPHPKPPPFPSGIERGHLIELLRRLGTADAVQCADAIAAGTRFGLDPATVTMANRIILPTREAAHHAGRAAKLRRRELRRLRRLGAEPIIAVEVGPAQPGVSGHSGHYTVLIAGSPDRAVGCFPSSDEELIERHAAERVSTTTRF